MKRIRKDNQGMTMVEVLMGFVILSLMLGMLSHIISFSSNLYKQSLDLKRVEENLEKYIYKKELPLPAEGTSVTVKEVHTEADGTEHITDAKYEDGTGEVPVSLNSKVYTISSKDFPPVISEEEDPEIGITLFH